MAKPIRPGCIPLTSVELKALRKRLDLTQLEFAQTYAIDLTAVRNWEQNRAIPSQTICLFLRLIEANAKAIDKLIASLESRARR